jgi:glycosyltransferase involved in cell wall biosynthesis
MRILQVNTRYREAGGEDVVASAEADLLIRAGHQVVRHVVDNPTGPVSAATSLVMSAWNPAAARALRRAVDRARPEVAHVHNTWFALSPSVIAALGRAGVPVVMTLHNYRLLCVNGMLFRDGRPCHDCVGTHPWRGVRHRCYRGSVVASTAAAGTIAVNRQLGSWDDVRLFLALNDFARQRFIDGGLPPERIWVKPNFVADPGARQAPPSRSRTVLYVGRLVDVKGVRVLLEAWHMLGPTALELVVVGDGPLRAALQQEAPPGVRFEGRLSASAVTAWMLRSRALVLPSIWYEGQPMAMLEAFACGLPVLASRLGGNVELLEPGGDGWLVTPDDPRAWVEALRGLDQDRRVDAAGRRVRQLYERRFNEGVGRSLLEAAYAAAIESVNGGRAHRAR